MGAGDHKYPLRILFVAGGLGKGGAEKQLIYMLRALKGLGADLRILTLASGEHHEQSLEALGLRPTGIGARGPARRVASIVQAAGAFKPHFIQATHFFASFYAGLAGRLARVPSIGAIRGDYLHDLGGIGARARWLLWLPTLYFANSHNARENALRSGLAEKRVHVLQNVIDLVEFDRRSSLPSSTLLDPDCTRVITVARLMPVKRLERFIEAVALARAQAPELEGVIVGGGPEEARLRAVAAQCGLIPNQRGGGLQLLGERSDIPQLLRQSKIFALTSDREGFPNVLLEAMAAALPILSTPAGETRTLLQDGVNGWQVPFDQPAVLAGRMVELARSPALRRSLGSAGRQIVETRYSYDQLPANLLALYRAAALAASNQAASQDLSSNGKI
jgi:glycosyltransferase involved in cell wall biosynthesis